jgi:hypothetical protein
MNGLKVGRPKTTITGSILALFCAISVIVVLSFGLLSLTTEELWASGIDAELAAYNYIFCGFVLAGGILILRRRYRLGGVFALVFSIFLMIDGWLFAIPGIVGGILALVSKERTPMRVLDIAKLYGSIGIQDLAAKTGKTEADVELAIIGLQSEGQPIRFDAEKREVIYG